MYITRCHFCITAAVLKTFFSYFEKGWTEVYSRTVRSDICKAFFSEISFLELSSSSDDVSFWQAWSLRLHCSVHINPFFTQLRAEDYQPFLQLHLSKNKMPLWATRYTWPEQSCPLWRPSQNWRATELKHDFLRHALGFGNSIKYAVSSVTKMKVLAEAVPVNTPRQTDANGETPRRRTSYFHKVCISIFGSKLNLPL